MTGSSPFLSLRHGACEVWLIRHGDAAPEADGFVAATYDDQPLNTRGRQQAIALAQRLKDIEFAALYSSPLLRCLETAQPLLDHTSRTLTTVADLREVKHSVDARRVEDMNASAHVWAFADGGARVGAYAMAHGSFDGLPDAEPRAQFRGRVRDAIDGLVAQHLGQRIALFAHGGVINVYAAEVLGLERDFFMPIANTAVSIVRVHGAQRMLVTLNDVCHLRGMKSN